MTAITLSPGLTQEYDLIFASAKIRSEYLSAVRAVAERIISPANWARYQDVGGKTGIPPYVIGIIHSLEASGRFDRHLHNGDPLTARTVQVPAGRPKSGKPPFTWEESAVDALADVNPRAGLSPRSPLCSKSITGGATAASTRRSKALISGASRRPTRAANMSPMANGPIAPSAGNAAPWRSCAIWSTIASYR